MTDEMKKLEETAKLLGTTPDYLENAILKGRFDPEEGRVKKDTGNKALMFSTNNPYEASNLRDIIHSVIGEKRCFEDQYDRVFDYGGPNEDYRRFWIFKMYVNPEEERHIRTMASKARSVPNWTMESHNELYSKD